MEIAGVLDIIDSVEFSFRPHFKFRAKQRGIDFDLAVRFYQKSEKRYWDNLRKHHVAIGTIKVDGRRRYLMLAYDKIGNEIEFITIHFIREREIQNKLNSGRWKNEQN